MALLDNNVFTCRVNLIIGKLISIVTDNNSSIVLFLFRFCCVIRLKCKFSHSSRKQTNTKNISI